MKATDTELLKVIQKKAQKVLMEQKELKLIQAQLKDAKHKEKITEDEIRTLREELHKHHDLIISEPDGILQIRGSGMSVRIRYANSNDFPVVSEDTGYFVP